VTDFAVSMKAHLAHYKGSRLGVAEDGIWRRNNRKYAHILPEDLQQLNILEGIRKEFWQYYDANKATLGLHTDFHHLNSSQAFAFNLFFPWVGMGEDPAPLLAALGLPGRQLESWSFEHMPDQAEATSVDFFAHLDNGSRLLVEVKLTEAHFGQCVPKDSHRAKLATYYAPRLTSMVQPLSLDDATFFLNYQLFRNVSHLDLARGDTLILLLPRMNRFTWREGEAFREMHLAEHAKGSVRLVAVEDVLEQLTASDADVSPRLRTHCELLAEKYLL
jgi:hypothetical protein